MSIKYYKEQKLPFETKEVNILYNIKCNSRLSI